MNQELKVPTVGRSLRVLAAIAAVLAVLAVAGGGRLAANLSSRTSPPAACQLLGGSWSPWNGWTCG